MRGSKSSGREVHKKSENMGVPEMWCKGRDNSSSMVWATDSYSLTNFDGLRSFNDTIDTWRAIINLNISDFLLTIIYVSEYFNHLVFSLVWIILRLHHIKNLSLCWSNLCLQYYFLHRLIFISYFRTVILRLTNSSDLIIFLCWLLFYN